MRLANPLDDLLEGRSFIRILRALDGLPSGLHASVREIARRAGVSHPTASAVLERLQSQGVVRVRRSLVAHEFRLNDGHVVADHVRQLFRWERGVPDELTSFLAREIRTRAPWVRAAYLFGSAL